MNSYDLNKGLDNIFLADYLSDPLKDLRSLSALYSYYRDDDAPEELDKTVNELNGLLLKIQLFRDADAYPSIPTEFKCSFKNTEQLSGHPTFSPVIKMPKRVVSPEFAEMLKELDQIISKLNLVRLKTYIKKKAIKAGDFKINDK